MSSVNDSWFSPGTLSSTNKTDRYDITEIVLNTITLLDSLLVVYYFVVRLIYQYLICDLYIFPLTSLRSIAIINGLTLILLITRQCD